jgi:heme-binding protein
MVDDGPGSSRLARSVIVSNHVVRTAGMVAAAGLVALANGGSALAQPGDSCSPGAVMRAQADMMNQMADYLAANSNADNTQPADPAAALRMAAAMRSIQADMASSCGLLMDQLPPGIPPGH